MHNKQLFYDHYIKVKVKASRTRYRALGPELILIPVYRQGGPQVTINHLPGLSSRTFARTVSFELLGFCLSIFFVSVPCAIAYSMLAISSAFGRT